MGSLDGIAAGLRNLRRTRPLEVMRVEVDPDRVVKVPTPEEMLRIKAYLVVQRNQVRDYLDVVALAAHLGPDSAAAVLGEIDDYYDDRSEVDGSVLTSLILALSDPQPRDSEVIRELPRYRGLAQEWHEWSEVVRASQRLALLLSES